MKVRFFFSLILFLYVCAMYAQQGSIKGEILFPSSDDDMSGYVSVSIPERNIAVSTNEQGIFSLDGLQNGTEYSVVVSCVGYETVTRNAYTGEYLKIYLNRKITALKEVTVMAYKPKKTAYTDSVVSLGPFSNKRLLDIPYSMTSLTSEMMYNLQVTSLNEISKYIPSMQIEARGGLEVGRPQTRGFQGSVVECSRLDGMNIVSTTSYPMEQFERFEVLNGITGSLYGPASPAGSFNYTHKRTSNKPVQDISISYQRRGIGTYHADLSRRFDYDDKSIGFRVNALYADGEGFAEYSSLNRTFLSTALDAQMGRLKIEANLGHYAYKQFGLPGGFSYGEDISLPKNIDPATRGLGQEWAGLNLHTLTASTRLIYSLNDNWKITAGILNQTVDRATMTQGITITSNDGDYTASTTVSPAGRFTVLSNMIVISGQVKTGSVNHNLVIGTNGFGWEIFAARASRRVNLGGGNLANPEIFPFDEAPVTNGHYKSSYNTQQSVNIGDDITFNRHFSALLSLSQSWIDNTSYSQAGVETSNYSDDALSYSASLLYKPISNMTVYATYSDVIQQGSAAPTNAANEGVILDPVRCQQYELGYKTAFKYIDVSLALFRVNRPFPFLDATDNVYKLQGDQVNFGGEIYADLYVRSFHLMGGLTYLNPRLKDTGRDATSNQQVVGVPKYQSNFFGELKLPFAGDLSLNANYHYTGKKAANSTNTTWIDGYSTFDLGLRYTVSYLKTRIIWNIQVTNLFNEEYWSSIFPGSINGDGSSYSAFLGNPREFKASMRILF